MIGLYIHACLERRDVKDAAVWLRPERVEGLIEVMAKEVSQSGGVHRGVEGCFAFLPVFNTKITIEIPDVFLYSDSLRKRYIVHCYVTIPRIDIEALPAELREGHHEGRCQRTGWAG